MSFQEVLVGAGFDRESAVKLVDDERFRQRNANKSSEEILQRIDQIAAVYNTDADHVIKAVSKFPAFVGYDHERAVKGIIDVYGWTREEAGKAVFKHPQFVGYDHERVVREIVDVYGWTREEAGKAVFRNPSFAGLDHERVVRGIVDVYGWNKEEVGRVVSKFPQFAGYDHERVIGGIVDVYGWNKEEVGRVVFKHPPFAGLDHERVVRQLGRIGRIVGLDEDTVKEKILKKPRLAGYSAKRYIAAVDMVRHLRTENALDDDTTIKMCLGTYPALSPYVPDTDKLRITQALRKGEYNEEPPLMKALRKSIQNQKVKAGRVKQRA